MCPVRVWWRLEGTHVKLWNTTWYRCEEAPHGVGQCNRRRVWVISHLCVWTLKFQLKFYCSFTNHDFVREWYSSWRSQYYYSDNNFSVKHISHSICWGQRTHLFQPALSGCTMYPQTVVLSRVGNACFILVVMVITVYSLAQSIQPCVPQLWRTNSVWLWTRYWCSYNGI